ncbi:MAG: YhbY family RNA-binding protein [Candidatus Altiarchaeota archaeon]
MKEHKELQIGKSGLSEGVLTEIGFMLKKHKSVRIRILKSARTEDRKDIFEKLKSQTGASSGEMRGYIIVLRR